MPVPVSPLPPAPPPIVSMLASGDFKLMYWMQFRFIQNAFRALVATLNSNTNGDFTSTINTKMALFIVFVIVVALAYLMLWTPFVNALNRDVSETPLPLLDLAHEDDADHHPHPNYPQDP